MMTFKIAKFAVLLLLPTGIFASNCTADDLAQAQQYFNAFCISCHGQKSSEAGIRLDKIDLQCWNDFNLLEDIYNAIESGEMPPEDAPAQPELGRSNALRKSLAKQLGSLADKQTPGTLKRLSRVEYQNTINDVFGTD
ncbi:MAG: DUF1587 domain-containing protein, partial [Rubripirellula sp.]|nr:DUF1587 domain-containing protein [Rubripirellula sp.]